MKEINPREFKIELTPDEQEALQRAIWEFRPEKVLEVGVFSGGVSRLILQGISSDSELHSVDVCSDPKIGSLCLNDETVNKMNWSLYRGKMAFEVLKTIGSKIDFVFLDADHVLPGEILDFLTIYPFLKREFVLAIHDTSLSVLKPDTDKDSIAPMLLASSIYGSVRSRDLKNIRIIKCKLDYIDVDNLFDLLYLPWKNLDILKYSNKISTYFNGVYGRFTHADEKFNDIVKFQIAREINASKLGNNE